MWRVAADGVMPKFWPPRSNKFWSFTLAPLRRCALRNYLRVTRLEDEGWDQLALQLAPGDSVLIAPNHSHDSDPVVLMEVGKRLKQQLYFMAAWQLFRNHGGLDGFFMQRMGAFSVDREGCDRRAIKQAVNLLSNGGRLVIFPEGDVYHLNERLTPLLEGVAFIALTAQRQLEHVRSGARVWLVPTAIRYKFIEQIDAQLESILAGLERRFLVSPPPGATLPQRITSLGELLLTLKEKEKLGHSREAEGTLAARLTYFMEKIVSNLEKDWMGQSPSAETVPLRIKAVRRVILETYTGEKTDTMIRAQARDALDQIHLALQLFSYPGNYLAEKPTSERLAETLSQLMEDTSGKPLRPPGDRAAKVIFGKPINLKDRMSVGRARALAGEITDELEERIRDLMRDSCINRGAEQP
jgi:1-acyl-sn-glycerol-3-phosphate acyltransferase